MARSADDQALYFKKAIFNVGVSLTIRLGHKWLSRYLAELDKNNNFPEFVIKSGNGNSCGLARVQRVIYAPFHQIPEAELATFHPDIDCQTILGAYESLKELYGDKFTRKSPMTFLYFVHKHLVTS